ADAGIVISASHNSMEYNGIKIFDSRGHKLPDEIEDRIEAIVLDKAEDLPKPTGAGVGRIVRIKNTVKDYVDFLKGTMDTDLRDIKIAIDCANGASYEAAPILFEALGADVHTMYTTPDGVNINSSCGSTYPKKLQSYVLEADADIGFAFDGDADRLIAVDENGKLVDGDQIMVMCALDMQKNKKLKNDTLVTTVMSNLGLDKAIEQAGLKSEKTDVGDRYVLEKMLECNYSLGGEQSGHVIFLDYNTTGDGLLTALQVLKVMKHTGKKISELAGCMKKYPQVLVNASVRDEKKHAYEDDPLIQEAIGEIESIFKDERRVLIRPSGTEPLVRVMIEGTEQREIEEHAVRLAKLIEERLS
ncbi:MAG TPA: phosphoglucosamine mutase, partial [Bacillota bacterium]|nr:phosphoglucosamine mutase [Bacillota bacterium]